MFGFGVVGMKKITNQDLLINCKQVYTIPFLGLYSKERVLTMILAQNMIMAK